MTQLDINSIASLIGVSVPVCRFLLCFVATIPVSFLWRVVPGRHGKHVYAAASGVVLSYLSFGFTSNLHFLVPMLLGYLSMIFFRAKCGVITFFLGFGYLIGWYILLALITFLFCFDLYWFRVVKFWFSVHLGFCMNKNFVALLNFIYRFI